MRALSRLLLLALGSLTCAAVAGLVALYAQGKTLPPSDLAYGMSVWESLGDRAVRGIWLLLVLPSAAVGFAFAIPTLWKVRLTFALPLVVLATSMFAGAFAFLFWPLSPIAGLAAGIVTMFRCRAIPEWRFESVTNPPRPSTDAT